MWASSQFHVASLTDLALWSDAHSNTVAYGPGIFTVSGHSSPEPGAHFGFAASIATATAVGLATRDSVHSLFRPTSILLGLQCSAFPSSCVTPSTIAVSLERTNECARPPSWALPPPVAPCTYMPTEQRAQEVDFPREAGTRHAPAGAARREEPMAVEFLEIGLV